MHAECWKRNTSDLYSSYADFVSYRVSREPQGCRCYFWASLPAAPRGQVWGQWVGALLLVARLASRGAMRWADLLRLPPADELLAMTKVLEEPQTL